MSAVITDKDGAREKIHRGRVNSRVNNLDSFCLTVHGLNLPTHSEALASQRATPLQEPSELGGRGTLPELLGWNILRSRLLSNLPVPPEVIKDHVATQKPRNQASASAKDGSRDQRSLVLGLLVLSEDVARDQTHEVGEGHTDGSQDDTTTFVGDVVVVPGRQEHRWRGCTPDHHEASEVGELELSLNILNGGVDDKAGESESKAQHDERETDPEEIGAESQNKQHNGTTCVRRHSVQVGLDDTIAKSRDDLGHEKSNTLNRHTKTDLNHQEAVGGRVLEDLDGVLEVELLRDD